MTKVEISGAGVSVTVEHEGTPDEVKAMARELLDHARESRATEMLAGGMGFMVERPGGPTYADEMPVDLRRQA